MVKSQRVFTREFKLVAIKELDSGKPLGLVARQLESVPTHCIVGAANSENNLRKRFPVRADVS